MFDANERVIPCAWALVLTEDEDYWTWFMEFLRDNLLGNPQSRWFNQMVIMSDRDKGLANAIKAVFPRARAAFCCQHIADNVRTRYGISSVSYFWKCARAKTEGKFKAAFEVLQDHNLSAAEYIIAIPLVTWTRYLFPTSRFGHDTNNLTESINASWVELRHLSPLRMLDAIWIKMMTLVYECNNEPHGTLLLAEVPAAKLKERRDRSRYYRVLSSESHVHQVEKPETDVRHIVNLKKDMCTCTNFQEYQSPCSHGLAALSYMADEVISHITAFYSLAYLQATYAVPLPPISLHDLVPDESIIPPMTRKQKGRPKK